MFINDFEIKGVKSRFYLGVINDRGIKFNIDGEEWKKKLF